MKKYQVVLLFFLIFLRVNVDCFSYHFDPKTRTEEWRLTDTLIAKRIYDPLGNPIEWNDWTGATYFTYNEQGQLKEVVSANGQKTQYNHAPDGTCVGLIYPSGLKLSYGHDCDKNMKEMYFSEGKVKYLYDYSRNLVKSRELGNGIVTDYDYDEECRISAIIHKDAEDRVIASFYFTYDTMGNRISFRKKTSLEDSTTRYVYDRLYRLTRVHYPDGSSDKYSYDLLGNRLCKETAHELIWYEYDDLGRLIRANDIHYFYNDDGSLARNPMMQPLAGLDQAKK